MPLSSEKYITDESGNRTGIILSVEEYKKILEDLEELEAIRAYDDAKHSNEEVIPFEQAIEEIEQNR